jgi:hypothetical protein
MAISEQAKEQLIELIYEGEALDPFDLVAFYRWVEASYEALEFDAVQQEIFDKYCRSPYDSIAMRLYTGVWMLKQTSLKYAQHQCTPPHVQV